MAQHSPFTLSAVASSSSCGISFATAPSPARALGCSRKTGRPLLRPPTQRIMVPLHASKPRGWNPRSRLIGEMEAGVLQANADSGLASAHIQPQYVPDGAPPLLEPNSCRPGILHLSSNYPCAATDRIAGQALVFRDSRAAFIRHRCRRRDHLWSSSLAAPAAWSEMCSLTPERGSSGITSAAVMSTLRSRNPDGARSAALFCRAVSMAMDTYAAGGRVRT